MREFGQYIISLCAASILCSILINISSRQGSHKKMITFLCGISMLITVISPWVTLRFDDLIAITYSLQAESSDAVSRGEESANEAIRDIIRSRSEAYILDKATELGLHLTVKVELSEDNGGAPKRVYIQGSAAPFAKSQLTDYISNTLGIAKENQVWT